MRDRIVQVVCNWVINTFASREYRARLWYFYARMESEQGVED